MSQDAISLHGVSAASLSLFGEDTLVRAAASEEQLSSGLWIMNRATLTWSGDSFYGIVVAVGPGRLVERQPSPERIASAAADAVAACLASARGRAIKQDVASAVLTAVLDVIRQHPERVRVPCPWTVGQHVCVRKGFGPEIELREGRHHVIGRGNSEYGHGILAHWDPRHTHCWHDNEHGRAPSRDRRAAKCCECGFEEVIETRFPTCNPKVPGPRLAEAQLGHKVFEAEFGRADPVPEYGPLEGMRAEAGELRPVEHVESPVGDLVQEAIRRAREGR